MNAVDRTVLPSLVAALLVVGCSGSPPPTDAERRAASAVYGEWKIRVRPEHEAEYERLVAEQGLSLYRASGGRMVGWWKTLVGDGFEHLTLWRFDDMGAFEQGLGRLSVNEGFAGFSERRNRFVESEESRFLMLTGAAEQPRLDDPMKVVVHETHRIPLRIIPLYVKFMEEEGLAILKQHGFRPVGPFYVNVGTWSELTILFRFDSMYERQQLRAAFSNHPDSRVYAKKLRELVIDIRTRLLMPAPFALPASDGT